MKAEELRIGNWYNSVKFKTPVVCELTDLAELCHRSDGAYNDPLIDEMFEPIPLTEEWLLKFGWKYQDRDVNRSRGEERFYISPMFGKHKEYYLEMQLPSSTPFNSPFVWLGWDIGGGKQWIHLPEGHEIYYVHQLQNLYYALTGKEL